jgi:hypothetical protein
MPAVSTRLEISCSTNSHVKHEKQELLWWDPRGLYPDERFTEVLDNGYLDRIAIFTRDEFASLNETQIQEAADFKLKQSASKISDLGSLLVNTTCSACEFKVILYEWESGLD